MWHNSLLLTPKPRSEGGLLPAPEAVAYALQSRVRELERERDEAARRTGVLLAVQRAMVEISNASGTRDVVTNLLRGAYDALGYSRALCTYVERDGSAVRAQLDGGESVVFLPDDAGGATLRALPPRKNGGGAHVVSPLVHRMRPLGVLYVDDRRTSAGGSEELVHALAAVAAAALGNNALLADAVERATLDPLTGLLNRRAVAERLSIELELCRSGARALTYVMVDVDDLKKINDTRGHAEGDETLKKVAAVLRRSSRAQDVVGRFGGDEFVIMLSGADRDLARALVARLSQNLRAQNLSCSIGAALLGAETADEPSLARSADRALYAAKAAGKNGFSFA